METKALILPVEGRIACLWAIGKATNRDLFWAISQNGNALLLACLANRWGWRRGIKELRFWLDKVKVGVTVTHHPIVLKHLLRVGFIPTFQEEEGRWRLIGSRKALLRLAHYGHPEGTNAVNACKSYSC